jgi:hypothetical protein
MRELTLEEMDQVAGGWSITIGWGPISITIQDEEIYAYVNHLVECWAAYGGAPYDYSHAYGS